MNDGAVWTVARGDAPRCMVLGRNSVRRAALFAALAALLAGEAFAQPSGGPPPAREIPPAAERPLPPFPPAPPPQAMPAPPQALPVVVPVGFQQPNFGPPPPFVAPSFHPGAAGPPAGQPFGAGSSPALRAAARDGRSAAAVLRYENDAEDIQEELEAKLSVRRRKLFEELAAERDRLVEERRFEEALEAHQAMRKIEELLLGVLDDPGALVAFRERTGRMFHFRVVGNAHEGVWGTDVYALESHLAAAAVHAGVLADGEKGVVRVKIRLPDAPFRGTTRHGVASTGFDRPAVGFTVEKP